MRALVVSNMRADTAHPERGRFVRDQVAALEGLEGVEVQLHEFPPGKRELLSAALQLRRSFGAGPRRAGGAGETGDGKRAAMRGEPFDVVHAHFGLTAWPALAVPARVRALTVHGTDVSNPRTRQATLAVLNRIDLLAAPSAALLEQLPPRAATGAAVLPCGVAMERFRPLSRAQARAELGLDPDRPYLLFPSDPARPEKRHDLAQALATACATELLVLGGVDPELVPLWVNAANAVLVPSDREGFGLATLEALACDVPVLATPVGIHETALRGVAGVLCAPFELSLWGAAVAPHLADPDPRVAARQAVSRFSSVACAEAVLAAWTTALTGSQREAAGSG